MKFVSVKKNADVKLEGITVDFDIVDNSVKAIMLKDAKGNVLRVSERAYNLYVEVPAPPEKEIKHKLSGEVIGLKIEKVFDNSREARDEMDRLCRETTGHTDLKIEEVEIDIPF